MKTILFIVSLAFLSGALSDFQCGENWIHTPRYYNLPTQMSKRSVERQTSFGITLRFGPTINQAQFDEHRSTFRIAADIWEELLAPTVLAGGNVLVDAELAGLGANILGATGASFLIAGHDVLRNALQAQNGVNAPLAANYTANLPANFTLDNPLRGIFTAAQFRFFGGDPLTIGGITNDGDITFSSDFSFDTDISDGIDPNLIDFLGVAVHELGHLLGFSSSIDGLPPVVVPFMLDWFRFATATLPVLDFADNTSREMDAAVNFHELWDPLTQTLVGRLSRGDTSPEARQASHWFPNEISGSLVGVMDPTLGMGEFITITSADQTAFRLLGFEIAADPCPFLLSVQVDGFQAGDMVTVMSYYGDQGSTPSCAFGSTIVPAVQASDDLVICEIPATQACSLQILSTAGILSNPAFLAINGADCANFDLEAQEACRSVLFESHMVPPDPRTTIPTQLASPSSNAASSLVYQSFASIISLLFLLSIPV